MTVSPSSSSSWHPNHLFWRLLPLMVVGSSCCTILLSTNNHIVSAFSSSRMMVPLSYCHSSSSSSSSSSSNSFMKRRIVTSMSKDDNNDDDDNSFEENETIGKNDMDNQNDDDNTIHELEQARLVFERLVTPQLIRDHHRATDDSTTMYTPPPLTEHSKRRRDVELQLLESLVDSDDAIDELMSLWMTERDYESTCLLQEMEDDCSPGLFVEEQTLKGMIATQNMDWAEPMSRLATVHYYQGKTEDAQQWCQIALAVKPWHFEVGHTLVLLALRRQEFGQALQYQRSLCLPRLNVSSNHRRRRAWVTRAIQKAEEMKHRAQQAHDNLLLATTSTSTSSGTRNEKGQPKNDNWQ